MTHHKSLFALIVLMLTCLASGCSTLDNASDLLDEAATGGDVLGTSTSDTSRPPSERPRLMVGAPGEPTFAVTEPTGRLLES